MTNKPMLSVDLMPCPFCGSTPTLPDGYGTQYEIVCDGCGQATSSIQICDLMTIDERAADMFSDYRYGEEFIDRAKLAAIESWNNRVEPAAKQPAPAAVVMPEPYGLAMFKMLSGFDSVTPEQFNLVWTACRKEVARLNGVTK